MKDTLVNQAALNNAIWCDTVCRTHGSPGEFRGGVWVNSGPVPRFYPNAVTLGGLERAGEHQSFIERLLLTDLPRSWSVKDSFQTLSLASNDFTPLFTAQWISCTIAPAEPSDHFIGIAWQAVTTSGDLAEWHGAWGGNDNHTGIFLPALLDDENIHIIAARREGRIVAGAIANFAAGVAGISNVFVPEDDGQMYRRGCVAAVSRRFPGVPIVGYEHSYDLTEMLEIGFDEIGPMTVWLRLLGNVTSRDEDGHI